MSGSKNPCCCMPLRTGAMIVAISTIISSVMFAVQAIVGLVGIVAVRAAIASDSEDAEELTPEEKAAIESWTTMAAVVVTLLIRICSVIVSSLLVHGISKEKPGLTTPWLIVSGIDIVFTILLIILGIVTGDVIVIIQRFISLGFMMWFFSVIYYYKQVVTALVEVMAEIRDGDVEGKL